MVTVWEAIASREPAGAHFNGLVVGVPLDASLNVLVGEGCGPCFAGAHLELLRLVSVWSLSFTLLLLLFISSRSVLLTSPPSTCTLVSLWGLSLFDFQFEGEREAEVEGSKPYHVGEGYEVEDAIFDVGGALSVMQFSNHSWKRLSIARRNLLINSVSAS